MPTTITSSTITTLIVGKTRLTRLDSFVPRARSTVSTPTSSRAPQSSVTGPTSTEVGTSTPNVRPSTVARYSDQALATTAEPTANSSTRSQPMIHAMNSPKV